MEVSTVFPTSEALANTLLNHADLQKAQVVIEVGAGTGAITKHLVQRLENHQKYIGVELDPQMIAYLRQNYPQLKFEIGPAENLKNWTGPNSVDVVISSLPWTVFSDQIQENTISAIYNSLKPGGIFVTYICVNAIWYPQARSFIHRLKDNFGEVYRSPIEWKNIPPAYIFKVQKPV